MRRYLIVANQTLPGPHLFEELLARREADAECTFHVVVPATPPNQHLTWTEGQAERLAQERLIEVLDRLHDAGIDASGQIGDANVVRAVGDVLNVRPIDEIILSTFPPGASRWLRADVPRRLQRAYPLPMTHVVATVEPVE